jgi:hypothetical protein
LAQQILPAVSNPRALLLADVEHYAVELLDYVHPHTAWDLLVPLRQTRALARHYQALPPGALTPHWAGYAIAREPFAPRRTQVGEPCTRYIQRSGERPPDYHCKGFGCTRPRAEVPTLTQAIPSEEVRIAPSPTATNISPEKITERSGRLTGEISETQSKPLVDLNIAPPSRACRY